MNNFQPNPDELQQVLQLLQHSQSPDTTVQRAVQQQLEQLNNHPQFCCYLVFILSELKHIEVESRSLAGLILKNNIRSKWTSQEPHIKQFVRSLTLNTIGDPNPLVRATVGIIITTIVCEEGIENWPILLLTMSSFLDCDDPYLQEGSLNAVQKVFEDSGDRLDKEVHIEPLLPKIMRYFRHSSGKVRGLAMNAVNSILMLPEEPISAFIDEFLTELFQRATDQDEEVQKQLCRSLTLLLDAHVTKMAPHLPNVINYMIIKTQDSNEAIALEACEFWLALAENNEICQRALTIENLNLLIPVLVSCMRYSEADIHNLRDDAEDAMVPDRTEDIKPRHHHSRAQKTTTEGKNENDEDEDDDDDDDTSTEWNIRKCAAASLDVLSSIFSNSLFEILLPILQMTLSHAEWEVRESGILALGAVAEGCSAGIEPHLPNLIRFLLTTIRDRKALIRSISCWTMSRFASFIVSRQHNEFLEPVLKELLARILDGNKRVQEAACSAFATLEEEATNDLVPYLSDILSTLVAAFDIYQAKNLLILYDAVGTLADNVGMHLAQDAYVEMLMRPLMAKWMSLNDEDKELFPLLECVSSVASAIGPRFLPYCENVFSRCISLIVRTLAAQQAHKLDSITHDSPDKDFLIASLDLLSGLAESLLANIEPLIARSNPPIAQLLLICAKDDTAEVRQSCFALIGDIAKTCYQHIQPCISDFVSDLALNLNPEHVSVCNNAIWALGEIALQMRTDLRPAVTSMLPNLISVINKPALQRTLLENTAITLGRLGLYCTDDLAPYLQLFLRSCCFSLRNIRDNADKESAFWGLCYLVNKNPEACFSDFIFFCDAISSWTNPPDELRKIFLTILVGFKQHIGEENWSLFINQFPPVLRQRFTAQFAL